MFLHPSIAWFAAGLAPVPLIIHLINRRRYRVQRWAAMAFLLRAQRRSTRRIRLERWLLLAIRTLIVILVPLALARPMLRSTALTAGLTGVSIRRILMIDHSLSTAAPADGGGSGFDRAIAEARRVVAGFGPTDDAVLMAVGTDARPVIAEPTSDRELLAERLGEISCTFGGTDIAGALATSATMARGWSLPADNIHATLLTDLQATSWAGPPDEPASPLGRLAQLAGLVGSIDVIDIGGERRGNCCVSRPTVRGNLLGGALPAEVSTAVSNFSGRDLDGLAIEIALDSRVVHRESVGPLAAGESRRLTVSLPLRSGSGFDQWRGLEARLAGAPAEANVVDADDRATAAALVRGDLDVLLVDGQPGATVFEGQAGYLATALAPKQSPSDRTLVQPRVITPAQFATQPLSDWSVVALCGVGRLSPESWRRLSEFVAGGGGLMIFMGEPVLADDYNRHAGDLLAVRLGAAWGGDAADGEDGPAFVRLSDRGLTHPAVRDFANRPDSGLFAARVFRYVRVATPAATRPATQPASAEIIMRYTDGAPALVTWSLGAGRVALGTTSAAMTGGGGRPWNNLAAVGDYVSLVVNLLGWVAPGTWRGHNVTVGRPLRMSLSAEQASLTLGVVTPDGRREPVGIDPTPTGLAAVYRTAAVPGLYRMTIGTAERLFSAAIEPAECDLRAIDAATRQRIERHATIRSSAPARGAAVARTARRDLAMPLLAMVVVLLAVETLLARWFGHQRGS